MPSENIIIDRDSRVINAMGRNILLSDREFQLFMLLHENAGRVFTKDELLDEIWSGGVELSAVSSLVLRLRRKIMAVSLALGSIESGYGEGYCLLPPKMETSETTGE